MKLSDPERVFEFHSSYAENAEIRVHNKSTRILMHHFRICDREITDRFRTTDTEPFTFTSSVMSIMSSPVQPKLYGSLDIVYHHHISRLVHASRIQQVPAIFTWAFIKVQLVCFCRVKIFKVKKKPK